MKAIMMFIIHLLELFLFSLVYEGPFVVTNKELVNLNDCKLSTQKNNQNPNVGNALNDDLFFNTPLMTHKGCYFETGSWHASVIHSIEWNITSSCSCKCRNNNFFALKQNQCACLFSLLNMMETNFHDCNYTCSGSKKDPYGDAKYYTVYTHKVRQIAMDTDLKTSLPTTFDKSISKISTTASFTVELTTETNDINLESSMLTSRWKMTVISRISTTASPRTKQSVFGTTNNVTEQRIKTIDINHGKTSPSSNTMSVISEAFTTTASSGTKPLIHLKITIITVITVVGTLITVGIAVVVILLLYRRKRKRIKYNSRNSASNDIHASLEGEQTMQMFGSNDRSCNRTNTVPFILQQKQRPGNISVSNYPDPVDMENEYQRLDFSMRSDLKEVHDDYAMQVYKQTSTPAVNDDGSKPFKKAGLTKGTIDLKEVYNNYSLPYDALSRPTQVNKNDMKIQIKVRPSVTMKDEKHNNVA